MARAPIRTAANPPRLPAATPTAPATERDERGVVFGAAVVVGAAVVTTGLVVVAGATEVVLRIAVEFNDAKVELELVAVIVDVVVLAGVAGTVVVTVVKLEVAVNIAENCRQSALPMDWIATSAVAGHDWIRQPPAATARDCWPAGAHWQATSVRAQPIARTAEERQP